MKLTAFSVNVYPMTDGDPLKYSKKRVHVNDNIYIQLSCTDYKTHWIKIHDEKYLTILI